MPNYETIRVKSKHDDDTVVFFIEADGFDMVPIVNFNPVVYRDHTKQIDTFIRDLAVEIIRKQSGDDAELDIIRGSELN